VYSIIFSQEPGQGRRVSRPPSVGDGIGFDLGTPHDLFESQKSSLFPWDNAGMSSSSGAPGMPGSDQIHVDPVELKLRGSSQSRRSSSLIPSQVGIAEGFSPAPIRQSSQAPEDYVFESMVFSGECFGD
jgi:meiotic recombination protein REC8, fungi type